MHIQKLENDLGGKVLGTETKKVLAPLLGLLILGVSATAPTISAQRVGDTDPDTKTGIPGFNDGDYWVVVRLNGKPIKGVTMFNYGVHRRGDATIANILLAIHPSSHALNKHLATGEDFNLVVQYIPKKLLEKVKLGEDATEEEIEAALEMLEPKSFGLRFINANVANSWYHIQKHIVSEHLLEKLLETQKIWEEVREKYEVRGEQVSRWEIPRIPRIPEIPGIREQPEPEIEPKKLFPSVTIYHVEAEIVKTFETGE
ncbi:MAG: hypothetical protein DRO11_01965 [Methanobacteriota archaeon]|nr:MAG: hypothetical protein DRO11_01965 [Euryarchaeota archaeon]